MPAIMDTSTQSGTDSTAQENLQRRLSLTFNVISAIQEDSRPQVDALPAYLPNILRQLPMNVEIPKKSEPEIEIMDEEANSGSDSDSTVEGKTPGEILEGPKIKPPSSDQIEALSPTSFYIYNKNTESYTLKNEDATKRRRSSSLPSKRRKAGKKAQKYNNENYKIQFDADNPSGFSYQLHFNYRSNSVYDHQPRLEQNRGEEELSVTGKYAQTKQDGNKPFKVLLSKKS